MGGRNVAVIEEVGPAKHVDVPSLRGSEWATSAHSRYATIFSIGNNAGVAEWSVRGGMVALGSGIVLVLAWPEVSGSLVISCVRDWLPTALVLVAYWSVDWFQPHHDRNLFDNAWIGVDNMLLRDMGRQGCHRAHRPNGCHIGFSPWSVVRRGADFSGRAFYLYRQRRRVDTFLSCLLFIRNADHVPPSAVLPLVFPNSGRFPRPGSPRL